MVQDPVSRQENYVQPTLAQAITSSAKHIYREPNLGTVKIAAEDVASDVKSSTKANLERPIVKSATARVTGPAKAMMKKLTGPKERDPRLNVENFTAGGQPEMRILGQQDDGEERSTGQVEGNVRSARRERSYVDLGLTPDEEYRNAYEEYGIRREEEAEARRRKEKERTRERILKPQLADAREHQIGEEDSSEDEVIPELETDDMFKPTLRPLRTKEQMRLRREQYQEKIRREQQARGQDSR